MPIRIKRWNDPVEADDGFRLLVTRYRPRALRSERENWEEWWPQLAPSVRLHADAYGKHGEPIAWETYRTRYLEEMSLQRAKIEALAKRVEQGEMVTLLCSSACTDESRCHRTLLRSLVEEVLGHESRPPPKPEPEGPKVPSKLREWLE